jgi:hypothetical protein
MGNRPKARPVKMTEVAQNAFGFKENTKVSVRSTKVKILTATRVFLGTVAHEDDGRSMLDNSDRLWRVRTSTVLGEHGLVTA